MRGFLLILLSLASHGYAQVIQQGSCPHLPAVQDFDALSYAGLWYEIAAYPEVFEAGGQCPIAEYSINEDGTVAVKNSMVMGNMLIYVMGQAYQVGNEALLVVSFDINGEKTESPLVVLATDYETYSVAVTCRDNGDGTRNFSSWILSREKTLSDEGRAEVNRLIDSIEGLEEDLFIYKINDDEACSSIYSAGYD